MRQENRFNRFILCCLISGMSPFVYSQTQAKFSLIPLTPTTVQLSTDQTYTVQYQLTNETPTDRTVVMRALPGIVQQTTGTDVCLNPAFLPSKSTCILTLKVLPSVDPSTIVGGPQICSVQPGTEVTPDLFFCSQPSLQDSLAIQRVASTSVNALKITPSVLSILRGGQSGIIYVTNPSLSVTATHIQANLTGTPLETSVTQDASGCVNVGPQSTCMLVFTSKNAAVSLTAFPIQGDNTKMAQGQMEITAPEVASLRMEGSPLILTVGSEGLLTVWNDSETITAESVKADLQGTALEDAGVVEDAQNCLSLAPGHSCQLKFTAAQEPVEEMEVPVSGTHASVTSAWIGVNPLTTALSITAGSPLRLRADGSSTGTMTIQNTGNAEAVNVMAHFEGTGLNGAVNATPCSSIPANGGTCVMTFTAGTSDVLPTAFPIYSASMIDTIEGVLSLVPPPWIYLSSGIQTVSSIAVCAVNTNSLSVNYGNPMDCVNAGVPASLLADPYAVSVRGRMFYTVNNKNNSVTQCHIRATTGALESCISTDFSQYATHPISIVLNHTRTLAYIGSGNNYRLSVCPVDAVTGLISNQNCTNYAMEQPAGLSINQADNRLYISNGTPSHTVTQCPLESNGQPNLSACQVIEVWTTLGVDQPVGITLNPSDSYLYFTDANFGGVIRCPLDAEGFVSSVYACIKQGFSVSQLFRNRQLAMNAAGTILYAGNAEDNAGRGIAQFSVDQNTGAVSFVGNNFGAPAGWGLGLFLD